MELGIKRHQAVIFNIIQSEGFVQGHPRRHEEILRKVLDPVADMPIVSTLLIVEPHEDVLWLYASHNTFEQARFSRTVPPQDTRHLAAFRCDESALKHR